MEFLPGAPKTKIVRCTNEAQKYIRHALEAMAIKLNILFRPHYDVENYNYYGMREISKNSEFREDPGDWMQSFIVFSVESSFF